VIGQNPGSPRLRSQTQTSTIHPLALVGDRVN